jgi:hypothetical protein
LGNIEVIIAAVIVIDVIADVLVASHGRDKGI